MSDKLRERVEACPFCGAVYDKENGVEHDDGCFFLVLDMWRVGPCDGERAMRAWNRRSLPAPREESGLRGAFVKGAQWFASLKWLPQSCVEEEVTERANEEAKNRYVNPQSTSQEYHCFYCNKKFPRTGQGWADCMNHQQSCATARPASADALLKVELEGSWRGWVFVKHPDGQWVSAAQLTDMTLRMYEAALREGAKEGT